VQRGRRDLRVRVDRPDHKGRPEPREQPAHRVRQGRVGPQGLQEQPARQGHRDCPGPLDQRDQQDRLGRRDRKGQKGRRVPLGPE
jgi:hypothetical protein